jgi:hypothetical protein
MNRTIAIIFSLLACGQMAAQQPLQLAPPQTENTWLLAEQEQVVAFDFRLAGAEIRYTTDGNEPTEASPIYTKPLSTKGLRVIMARSFKQGFVPSATTTIQLVQPGCFPIDSIAIAPAAKKYVANGWKTLCDGTLGDDYFHENWLGFDEKAVEIKLFFSKKRKVSKLDIGYLRNQDSWIFDPASVEVFNETGRLLATFFSSQSEMKLPNERSFISLTLPPGKHKSLTIKVKGLPTIPDWHPGKGGTGWFFLDEVVVY